MTMSRTAAAGRDGVADLLRVPVAIGGTGVYLPPRTVDNTEIVRGLDTTEAWVTSRTGIRQRRFLDDALATSDMCVAAALGALEAAAVTPGEIDAIVLATFTQDQPLPSTALIVKEAIGASNAWPLDLNQSACAGGVYGLLVGAHLLQGGFRNVLVIGAETLSRVTDPQDRGTRIFFGDAAGAVLLRPSADGFGLLSWDIGSELSHAVQVPAGGSRLPTDDRTVAHRQHFLRMDGRVVWEKATANLTSSILATLARAGISPNEADHYVLHQANLNIVNEVMDRLAVPRERTLTTVAELGNTGAATIFTVLDQLFRTGSVGSGDVLVMSAVGAGFLWGTLCLRHP